MRLSFLDYRFAETVLDNPKFLPAKRDIIQIFSKAPVPLLDPKEPDGRKGGVKRRERKPLKGSSQTRVFFLPVDQTALNTHLDDQFKRRGWALHPWIAPHGTKGGNDSGLRGDYEKDRIHVEVQFGNMARWYTDVFKFQLSYSRDAIDVAILVVPTKRFANCIDENVAYFERVQRELPLAKMSLTLPIWVIGIEPPDFASIRQCYDAAFETFRRNSGKAVAKIPFERRIAEEPKLDDDKP